MLRVGSGSAPTARPSRAATRPPCIKAKPRHPKRVRTATAGGRPAAPRANKPVPELGAPPAGSVIPNGRKGTSPHAQGRERNRMFVGIDVSKDSLDIHILPSGESFAVARDGEG